MTRLICRHLLLAICLALPFSIFAHTAHSESGAKRPASAAPKEQKPWGIGGDARDVRRTIEVTMSDNMRFTPNRLEVREGETVRLVVKNAGKAMHELVIGTRQELDEHAALMQKFPNMAHDEPYMAHVSAGKTGQLVWRFNRAGDFEFACLVAGHYQAGMVGTIRVIPTSTTQPKTR